MGPNVLGVLSHSFIYSYVIEITYSLIYGSLVVQTLVKQPGDYSAVAERFAKC